MCESAHTLSCACVCMCAWVCTQHVTSAGNYVRDWTNLAAQCASVAAPLAAERHRYKTQWLSPTLAAFREAQNSSVYSLKLTNCGWSTLVLTWQFKNVLSGISGSFFGFVYFRQSTVKQLKAFVLKHPFFSHKFIFIQVYTVCWVGLISNNSAIFSFNCSSDLI